MAEARIINADVRPSRPLLRYHGGKWRLADWVLQHLPAHQVYVEPYCGSASVLLRKPRSYGEVINDLDGEITNVFRVLRDQDQAQELERLLCLTPYARAEFEGSYLPSPDAIEQARRTITRTFLGFGSNAHNGDKRTGFRAVSWNHHTPGPTDWANYPQHVFTFASRLRGVVIESRPALEVIRQHDTLGTAFYVDPPYVAVTRQPGQVGNYRHEMTDDDHRALATTLRGLSGMVVLSGYPCALYDEELFPDWRRVVRKALADGALERTEVLWLNPACSEALERQRMQVGLFAEVTR